MKTCLLVIDVQAGFITESTRHVLDRLNFLLKSKEWFDFKVFTKFVNKEGSPFQTILNWNGLIDPDEQKIVLDEFLADKIITKTTYSSLTDEMTNFLKRNEITTVYIAGIDTDCCVLKTAVDLFERNYHPIVLEYYSASTGGIVSHESALTVLKRFIGEDNIIYGPLNENRKPSL